MTHYPQSTELKTNLSIFHLPLRHKVEYKTFDDFYKRLKQQGWQLHEYLTNSSSQRDFMPDKIFTPYAHESLFGKTRMDDEETTLKERLNPNNKTCSHIENLLLTQKKEDNKILNTPLHLNIKECVFEFTIEWIDLWLFNDTTGILAFKTNLEKVKKGDKFDSPTVDDLNLFNRVLRYPNSDNSEQKFNFWNDIIYNQCLGLNHKNVLMQDEKPEKILNPYNRYSKLFTVAQISNIEDQEKEFLWNRPMTNQDFTKNVEYKQWQTDQASPAIEAYQHAIMAGYPNLQDLLLLELATTSDEGKSWNDKAWQYDADYIKQLFADQYIKIWAYWSGLVLRDVCAFMVYDDTMPLTAKKQAESYYYPLYIYIYHQRFCLEVLSEEIIDHSLHDCVKARQILEKFHAFHNQYWLKDITIEFQGAEIAERMKIGLEIENKYQTVKEEITEITSFIETKVQAGRQTLIALLILAFYPFQYFGVGEKITKFVAEDMTLFIGINLGFIVIVLVSWFYLLPRSLGPFCKILAKLYKKSLE